MTRGYPGSIWTVLNDAELSFQADNTAPTLPGPAKTSNGPADMLLFRYSHSDPFWVNIIYPSWMTFRCWLIHFSWQSIESTCLFPAVSSHFCSWITNSCSSSSSPVQCGKEPFAWRGCCHHTEAPLLTPLEHHQFPALLATSGHHVPKNQVAATLVAMI